MEHLPALAVFSIHACLALASQTLGTAEDVSTPSLVDNKEARASLEMRILPKGAMEDWAEGS